MRRIEDRGSRIEDRKGGALIFLLVLMCTVLAQQPNRYGKITGRVLGEDGQPLSNAVVRIYPGGVTNAGPPRNTTTDDEGNFVFEQLPPRSYRVEASGRGYVTPPEPEPRRYYRVGEHVTLTLVKGGVITGRVTDALSEPLPVIDVAAIRVRDADGLPIEAIQQWSHTRQTDDRGIYRIYGLPPGTYIAAVNQRSLYYTPASGYEGEAPTYYPSATRDTAVEFSVRSGEETNAIDIRYRGERGRIISGRLTGAVNLSGDRVASFSVQLKQLPQGAFVSFANVRSDSPQKAFAIYGVLDGEYELSARRSADNDAGAAAKPQRIVVKGADVTGLELALVPLATIAGRVTAEKLNTATPGKCAKPRPLNFEEVLLRSHRVDQSREAEQLSHDPTWIAPAEIALNDKGEFTLRSLDAGRYRLETRLPNEDWYVKAISLPAAPNARRSANAPASPMDAARNGLTLKQSEHLTGVTITLAEGAAALSGKVVAATASAKLPAQLRVFLIPAEATAADEVLRYAELRLRPDGGFAFSNVAPGKYWLLPHPAVDGESSERAPRPLAWEQIERAKLRRVAEAAKQEIELAACQRVNDLTLKFNASQ